MAITINLVKGDGYLKRSDLDLSMYSTNCIIYCMDKDDTKKPSMEVPENFNYGGVFFIGKPLNTIEKVNDINKNYYSVIYKSIDKWSEEILVGYICDTETNVSKLHEVTFNAPYRICTMLTQSSYVYCAEDLEAANEAYIEYQFENIMYIKNNLCYLYTENKSDSDDLIGRFKVSQLLKNYQPMQVGGSIKKVTFDKYDFPKRGATMNVDNWKQKFIQYEYLISCLDDTTTKLTVTTKCDITGTLEEVTNRSATFATFINKEKKDANGTLLTAINSKLEKQGVSKISDLEKAPLKYIFAGTVTTSNDNPRIGDNVTVSIEPNSSSAVKSVEFENCELLSPTSDSPEWAVNKNNFTIDITNDNPKIVVTFYSIDQYNLEMEQGVQNGVDFSNYATKGDLSNYVPSNEYLALGKSFEVKNLVSVKDNVDSDFSSPKKITEYNEQYRNQLSPEYYGIFEIEYKGETIESDGETVRNYYLVTYTPYNDIDLGGKKYTVGFICNTSENINSLKDCVDLDAERRVCSLLETEPYLLFCQNAIEAKGNNGGLYFDTTNSRVIKMYTSNQNDSDDVVGLLKRPETIQSKYTVVTKHKNTSSTIKVKSYVNVDKWSQELHKTNQTLNDFIVSKDGGINTTNIEWIGKYVNYNFILDNIDTTPTKFTYRIVQASNISNNVNISTKSAQLQSYAKKYTNIKNGDGVILNQVLYNGSVSVSNTMPCIGDNVQITITPNQGVGISKIEYTNCEKISCETDIQDGASKISETNLIVDITGENPNIVITFDDIDSISQDNENSVVRLSETKTMSAVRNEGFATKKFVTTMKTHDASPNLTYYVYLGITATVAGATNPTVNIYKTCTKNGIGATDATLSYKVDKLTSGPNNGKYELEAGRLYYLQVTWGNQQIPNQSISSTNIDLTYVPSNTVSQNGSGIFSFIAPVENAVCNINIYEGQNSNNGL